MQCCLMRYMGNRGNVDLFPPQASRDVPLPGQEADEAGGTERKGSEDDGAVPGVDPPPFLQRKHDHNAADQVQKHPEIAYRGEAPPCDLPRACIPRKRAGNEYGGDHARRDANEEWARARIFSNRRSRQDLLEVKQPSPRGVRGDGAAQRRPQQARQGEDGAQQARTDADVFQRRGFRHGRHGHMLERPAPPIPLHQSRSLIRANMTQASCHDIGLSVFGFGPVADTSFAAQAGAYRCTATGSRHDPVGLAEAPQVGRDGHQRGRDGLVDPWVCARRQATPPVIHGMGCL